MWKLKFSSRSSLIRAATPSCKQRPVRHDDTGAPSRLSIGPGSAQLAHDELEEEERGFRRLPVVREVALDALLLLAAEWRVRDDDVDAIAVADLAHAEPQRVERIDLRRLDPVEQEVHLAEQIGERLRLDPVERRPLEAVELLDGVRERPDVLVRLDEEAARPAAGSSTTSPGCGSTA